jgi:hypothetical protein
MALQVLCAICRRKMSVHPDFAKAEVSHMACAMEDREKRGQVYSGETLVALEEYRQLRSKEQRHETDSTPA